MSKRYLEDVRRIGVWESNQKGLPKEGCLPFAWARKGATCEGNGQTSSLYIRET